MLTPDVDLPTAIAPPHFERLDAAEVARALATDPARGLDPAEVSARQARHGPNVLAERGGRPAWRRLLDQFASTLIVVLLVAAGISAAVGSPKDAVAILAIVVLNAALGFVQEARAERAMAALKRLAVPLVRARRGGQVVELPSSELVPGDVVLLEAGNVVPADGRVVESASLKVQEAILTGESEAVEKHPRALDGAADLALGDQANMAFMGTSVAYGRGQILVTAIGMATQLGRVADLLQGVDATVTPLQRRLDRLGRVLALVSVAIVVAIFGFGILLGEDTTLMFMTSVSMAVALIPEGLPAVVTISLALGAQRMLKRHALIRRLPAVETLGSVTVICSDKTGTLTENRMTVTVLQVAGRSMALPTDEAPDPATRLLLTGGALCSDAELEPGAAPPRALGDPTEAALVVAAAKFDLKKNELEAALPRIGEVPFDSERKRMSTLHRIAEPSAWPLPGPPGVVLLTKGAADGLLEVSTEVLDGAAVRPLDAAFRARIAAANLALAEEGMRVLGLAYRPLAEGEAAAAGLALERDLVFVGLFAMIDPPRPEVRDAVRTCRAAGIHPIMITGDHPVTARRIAEDLDLLGGGEVVSGPELARLDGAALEEVVERASVFARVAPEQKLRIVEALQRRGEVVAMTGDGVNDAPALRRAEIGVAMGITGTDVSKEASAMVLLDDNFTTIVAAVEEGRAINDNIRRFLQFSLAGNLGKLVLVFAGPLLGMPLPLLPFQILWLNLVTDGVLGLGIGVEPAERGTMRRPPQDPKAGIFAGGLGLHIVWQGLLLGAINLAVAYGAFRLGLPSWQTLAMTTVMVLQVFQALASRSMIDSVFRVSPTSNPALLGAIALITVLQLVVIFAPPLQGIFGTAPLSFEELLVPGAAGLVVFVAVELAKWARRRLRAGPPAPDR